MAECSSNRGGDPYTFPTFHVDDVVITDVDDSLVFTGELRMITSSLCVYARSFDFYIVSLVL